MGDVVVLADGRRRPRRRRRLGVGAGDDLDGVAGAREIPRQVVEVALAAPAHLGPAVRMHQRDPFRPRTPHLTEARRLAAGRHQVWRRAARASTTPRRACRARGPRPSVRAVPATLHARHAAAHAGPWAVPREAVAVAHVRLGAAPAVARPCPTRCRRGARARRARTGSPSRVRGPPAPLEILGVHEEALVEPADVVKRVARA